MFTKGTVPEDVQCNTNDTQVCPSTAFGLDEYMCSCLQGWVDWVG